MWSVPELMPISRLRQTQNEILDELSAAPVVLTQHGRAVAVLVDPEMWNDLIAELETWQDSFAALETKYEIAVGTEEVIDWETSKVQSNAAEQDALPD